MKKMKYLSGLIFCVLLLSSCNTTQQESAVILLRQRDASVTITPAIRVEQIAVERKIGEQKTVYTTPKTIPAGGISWLAKEVEVGSPPMEISYYDVAYDFHGNELSRTRLYDADVKIPASNRIREYGSKVEEGTYFFPKFSRYGLDCEGCGGQFDGNANTANGVNLDVDQGVRQASGEWLSGITWQGYYIVAADKSLPFCTILEISNHNFSGAGLIPGIPFKAIVLDRGGAITKNKLDLYVGTEANLNTVRYVSNRKPLAKIIRVGGQIRSNSRICKP